MNGVRSLLGSFHLAAGFIALAAFWFPLFTRKGGRFHRTAGWIFVAAMSAILASAAIISTPIRRSRKRIGAEQRRLQS